MESIGDRLAQHFRAAFTPQDASCASANTPMLGVEPSDGGPEEKAATIAPSGRAREKQIRSDVQNNANLHRTQAAIRKMLDDHVVDNIQSEPWRISVILFTLNSMQGMLTALPLSPGADRPAFARLHLSKPASEGQTSGKSGKDDYRAIELSIEWGGKCFAVRGRLDDDTYALSLLPKDASQLHGSIRILDDLLEKLYEANTHDVELIPAIVELLGLWGQEGNGRA